MGVIRKFPTIVSLKQLWGTNLCEDRKKSKGHSRRALGRKWNRYQDLNSVIDIIQEEFENTVGHTLKVDDIYLASNA